MLKKITLVFCAVVLFSLSPKLYANFSNGFAIGGGLEFGYNFYGSYEVGALITTKIPYTSIVIGLVPNAKFSDEGTYFSFAFNLDFWLLRHSFSELFHIYFGPGIGFNFEDPPDGSGLRVSSNGSNFYFDIGIRIPLGFQFLFSEKYEIFIEIAPHMFFLYVDGTEAMTLINFNFKISSSVGFRYWL